jgi:hypothetical protein
MASTINASTTAGLVQTADTSGVLQLQTAGTTIAALTSTGMAVTGTLSASGDATISGLTVGKGGGSIATNTSLGASALNANTTGTNNIGIGYVASPNNTTGLNNTVVGSQALYTNSTGSYNTAIGMQSLNSNTTDSNNTAVGYAAGYNNTTAQQNVLIGSQAGYQAGTGGYNVAAGYYAGFSMTSATGNVMVGVQAGVSTTTGIANTFVGGSNSSYVGRYNTTGYYNTAIGSDALSVNTTGFNNVALGYTAGGVVTTGSYNTYIGFGSSASSTSVQQEIVIGTFNMTGKGGSTAFISANGGNTYNGANSASWAITSDARLKKNIVDNTTGLSAITAIQVRNFEYRTADEVTELDSKNAIDKQGIQLGAIAQELKEILPECVKTESTGVMSVDTTNLTWYLVNSIKEQQALITSLTTRITALEGATSKAPVANTGGTV